MIIIQLDYRLNDEIYGVVMLDLLLMVTEEKDPYETGDSPTTLTVEFVSCIADNGRDYDFTNLHKHNVDKITKLACDKHRGY